MRTILFLAFLALPVKAAVPVESDLFQSGREGYHTFRIPALLVTPKGTILAFCEGRKHGRGDSGEIHTVLKRSLDNGKTWLPLQVVARDGGNTVGNPCPVVDRTSGTIWLLLTHNLGKDNEKSIRDGTSKGTRGVWVTRSTDEGATWSKPANITRDVKPAHWTWYATGPGIGIQLTSGRMIVPCDHTEAKTLAMRSHVIFSDDHGETWKLGGVLDPQTNECQIIQRQDGSLLLNMRSYHGKNRRAIATSDDAGKSWSRVVLDSALIEPVCQASLIRTSDRVKDRVLFSNPASTRREKMTVRLSEDGGKTWIAERLLYAGPAAYSSLAENTEGRFLCLYERGKKSPYETITLARFDLAWIRGDSR